MPDTEYPDLPIVPAKMAERNAPIRMVFEGQELTLSAGAVDEAQAIETLGMKMTTAVKPVEFNGQQEADSDESMDYRYLLVPMRFNN